MERHPDQLATTGLVGRTDLLQQVILRLQQPHSLISVTGLGGVGKTALVSAAAHEIASHFPDGVIWLDSQDATGAATVLRDLAKHSGFGTKRRPTLERLAEFLAPQQLLIIVDNLEHVLDLRRDLAFLYRTCTLMSLVVVSRRQPGMGDERIEVVPLARADAITLFRRQSGSDPFGLSEKSRASRLVGEICRLIDDLPLAIELAAAKAATFELQVLADLVRDYPLAVLSGGGIDRPERLRSIRGSIDWSYDALPEDARYVLRQLSVFELAGSFDALARVTGYDPGRLSDALNQLIEHGLVRFADGSYRMLQLTHRYCLEQLASADEEATARDRHAAYYVRFAMEGLLATTLREGSGTRQWQRDFDGEQGNIDAAYYHLLVTGNVRRALELATALRFYWWKSNRAAEGVLALDLALTEMPAEPSLLVAQAWATHALLSALLGNRTVAGASLLKVTEHLVELGAIDPHDAAELALQCEMSGAYVAAAESAHTRERVRLMNARDSLAELADHAERLFFRAIGWRISIRLAMLSLILAREPGAAGDDPSGLARGRLVDSLRFLASGDPVHAIQATQDALKIAMSQQHHAAVYQAIGCGVAIAAFGGEWETAARLMGAADNWAGETVPMSHRYFPDAAAMIHKRWDQVTVAELGRDCCHNRWAEGFAEMPTAFAVAALDKLAQRILEVAREQSAQANPLNLTPRPVDVAKLIARGRSNRQIADELFIDSDTVKTHRRVVRRAVRAYLGLDNSAELDDRRLVETLRHLYGARD